MAGFSTPLLDFFKRGDVERDLRLLAAKGALAPRAHEQLGLLMLLTADRDAEVASTAEATLSAIPVDSLAHFLAGSDVSAETRAFFAARGVEPDPDAGDEEHHLEAVVRPKPSWNSGASIPIVHRAPRNAPREHRGGRTDETVSERACCSHIAPLCESSA